MTPRESYHPPEHRTLQSLLEARADVQEDGPFLHYEEQSYTYGDVNRTANAIANALADRGVGAGDRVCTLLHNSPEHLFLWFALMKLGAVFVPFNVALKRDDLAYVIEDSGVETIVLEDETRENYETVRDNVESITDEYLLDGANGEYDAFDDLLSGETAEPSATEVTEDSPASIIYTSGTTGLPKGVVLPHFSYPNTGKAFSDRVELGSTDRLYVTLPMFHVACQQLAVMGTMSKGGEIVLDRHFSASQFWDRIREHDATTFFYIGTMIQAVLNQDERSDDADNPAQYGFGAAVPEELVPSFEERFDVELVDSYGLTEVGTLVTFNAPGEQNVTREGSAGKVIEHGEIRIVDNHDRPVEAGEVGEITFRSHVPNAIMSEYDGKPEQTVETWRNLWLHTGDMGYLDEDRNLYFVDRKAYSIRHRGENVSSREVEKILLAHPDVDEVAVVGVPGELGDEDVKAVVKSGDSRPDPQALVDHCQQRLASFKVPRYVAFTDEFPKTETQRIEKYKLKEEGVGDSWDRKQDGE